MAVDNDTLDRGDDFEFDEDEELEESEESENDEDSLEDSEGTDDSESEETEEDTDEEDEEEPKEIMVPKARLEREKRKADELRERSLWLEEQLEKLIDLNNKNQAAPSKPTEPIVTFDFDQAEENYATLLIEGEAVKASALRRQIDNERQKEFKALIQSIKDTSVKEATDKINQSTETTSFQTLITTFEEQYKFLDSEADEYNEEAVDTVNTLLAGYVAAGKTKVEALKLAVGKVVPMFTKTEATTKKTGLGGKRAVEARKKAAQAANSQPTKTKSTTKTDVDTGKLNISKMSERDFNKLTAKELALLRGD